MRPGAPIADAVYKATRVPQAAGATRSLAMAPRCSLMLSLAVSVAGHGMMTLPTPRSGGSLRLAAKGGEFDVRTFNNASWFTQDARIPGRATNCGEYVTGVPCEPDSVQPWRAPGTAVVFSPCGGFCVNEGVGSPGGCELGREPDNWWTVKDGRDLPHTPREQWTIGGTAKVAFTALYNHGGGYSYRLCPAGEAQTEACFQRAPLVCGPPTDPPGPLRHCDIMRSTRAPPMTLFLHCIFK